MCMKQFLLTILTALVCLCACDSSLPGGREEKEVRFIIDSGQVMEPVGKSVLGPAYRILNRVDILVYQKGDLRRLLSTTRDAGGASSLSVSTSLMVGETYDILVIANYPVLNPPATLQAALDTMVYRADGMSPMVELGVPMCAHKTVLVSKETSRVEISLSRLAAWLAMDIDRSGLQHGNVEIRSAKVCQMNTSCPLFSEGKAVSAADVCDGDLCTTGDIKLLNSGWEAFFYILENRQGTLLPGNADPDLKNPESLRAVGADPGLCTYLEVEAVYTDFTGTMIGEPVVARFYLGEDACTDFSVNRNWRYKVRLALTDDICFRTDWKMECSLADGRWLAFEEPSTGLSRGETKDIKLSTNLRGYRGDYSYEFSGNRKFFETSVDDNMGIFTVTARNTAYADSRLYIDVTSWDGKLSASHMVYIK